MTSVTSLSRSHRSRAALIGALSIVLLAAGPAVAETSYGHTGAPDRTLLRGCHDYNYHYKVHVPGNDWMLETFLVDPRGEKIASDILSPHSDPNPGQSVFRFCRANTVPGRFKIKAKIEWFYGDEVHKKWFKPSYFRLRRR